MIDDPVQNASGISKMPNSVVENNIISSQNLERCIKNTEIEYDLKYDRPYIATVNDPQIIDTCKHICTQYLGESAWVDIDKPVMSSEDFSYYINENPGGMFFLGMGEDSPGLHTNTYDFNDKALKNGIKFFVHSTIHFLSKNNADKPKGV